MTESLFREYVAKYLSPITAKIYETINARPEGSQPALLYKTMLTEEFTPKDTWDSASLARSVVAADVVALDSPLPLKSRGSFAKATGKIPKLGLAFRKKESDIKDIQTMIAMGGTEAQIVSKLMSDADLCVKGIEVAKEIMFLQGYPLGRHLLEMRTLMARVSVWTLDISQRTPLPSGRSGARRELRHCQTSPSCLMLPRMQVLILR